MTPEHPSGPPRGPFACLQVPRRARVNPMEIGVAQGIASAASGVLAAGPACAP
jgi:hypothetical protein